MNYDCSQFKPFLTKSDPLRLAEFEEARDILTGVSEVEGYCIANFRFGKIALPLELHDRLLGMVGKRCAILHLDGYHVKEY